MLAKRRLPGITIDAGSRGGPGGHPPKLFGVSQARDTLSDVMKIIIIVVYFCGWSFLVKTTVPHQASLAGWKSKRSKGEERSASIVSISVDESRKSYFGTLQFSYNRCMGKKKN